MATPATVTPPPPNASPSPESRFPRRAALAICWVGSLLLLGGCAGYTLGPTNGMAAGSRSVQINLFGNQTQEPRLAEPIANAIRKRVQQDGTFQLATHGTADVIVDGTLVGYQRDPLSFNPSDIVTTRDYEARLTAKVRAVNRATGRVLFDRELIGKTLIAGQADRPSAERQAVPLLAEDLARNITSLLVDGRW